MVEPKTEEEIELMRENAILVSKTLAEVGKTVAPGVTTLELNRVAETFIRDNGAIPSFLGYDGFPAALCISVNDVVVHGFPSDYVLKEGDIVSVDICLEKDGYVSDSTHTYEIGKVSEEVHQLNVVTNKCLYLGIEAASQPHARIQDIGAAVSSYARKFGYGVVRDYCGHGVGFSIHEDPEVPNYVSLANPNPRLREGMVIAIEPMINMGTYRVRTEKDGWGVKTLDGKPACHWEHTVAITENGLEILTQL